MNKHIYLFFSFVFVILFGFRLFISPASAQTLLTYSGIITNGAGTPLFNADITLYNGTTSDKVYTASDGSFILHVPVGIYNLHVGTYGVAQSVVPSLTTEVQNITISTDTVQNLTIPTQFLTVAVLDSSGHPVANAQVAGYENTTIPSPLFTGGPDVNWGFTQVTGFTDINGVIHMQPFVNTSVGLSVILPPLTPPYTIVNGPTIMFTGPTNITISTAYPTAGVITTSTIAPIMINTEITASASFSEGAFTAPHTATWDWGDGTTSSGSIIEANGSGSVSDNHTYTTAGVYSIKITVADQYFGQGSSTYNYVAVYNPTPSGLFSAARLFTSPPGAYTQNLQATGKVFFGITVKYFETTPTGKVNMNFKAGNLEFISTSISVLVTSGTNATLRGTGTINGSGNYTFLATGIDGHDTGGQDLIRFQIKDSSGNVIYDTQPGASDTVDPITSVTGQIIVH